MSGIGNVWGQYDVRCIDLPGLNTVAGGEQSLLESAFALAQRGHTVHVFYPGKRDSYRDVEFFPLDSLYLKVLDSVYSAVLSWSDERVLRVVSSRVRRIFVQQLNDLPSSREFWRVVDVIMPASASHARYLQSFAPPGADVGWIPLYAGVRPERFMAQRLYRERPHRVGWWSSPDRGLHHLLLMWPRIKQAVPDAELVVGYHLWRVIESARSFYRAGEVAFRSRMLQRLVHGQPDIKYLGAIPRVELAEYQIRTRVQAFTFDPVHFTEGFGCALSDGIAAGCHVIARPQDALPEIYGPYVEWVDAPICDDEWRNRFADRVIAALLAEEHPLDPFGVKRQEFTSRFTWEACAIQIERAFYMKEGESAA